MWTITAQHEGNRAALNISAQHGFLCAFKWGYFSNFAFGLYESIFEYIIRTLIILLQNFLQQNWLKSRKRISSHGWRQDFISVLWTGFTPQGIWVSVSPAKTQIRRERNLDICERGIDAVFTISNIGSFAFPQTLRLTLYKMIYTCFMSQKLETT